MALLNQIRRVRQSKDNLHCRPDAIAQGLHKVDLLLWASSGKWQLFREFRNLPKRIDDAQSLLI
jgi:hypothetical protein